MNEMINYIGSTPIPALITLAIGWAAGIVITYLYMMQYKEENKQMKSLLGRDINKPFK